jgi:hypothetical protein
MQLVELQLFHEEVLDLLNAEIIEIDGVRFCFGFDGFVANRVKKWVINRIINRDAIVRIEEERSSHEILSLLWEIFKNSLEILSLFVAEGFDIFDGFLIGDETIIFFIRCSNYLKDFVTIL